MMKRIRCHVLQINVFIEGFLHGNACARRPRLGRLRPSYQSAFLVRMKRSGSRGQQERIATNSLCLADADFGATLLHRPMKKRLIKCLGLVAALLLTSCAAPKGAVPGASTSLATMSDRNN